jgi:hypothetical protein
MASEGANQREIWLALGKLSRLFRLNTGRGWISNLGPKGVQKLTDGSVRIFEARSVALGFAGPNGDPISGACDLPGWTTVEITPEMVGRKVAVFTSIECKASKGGRVTPEQKNWMDQVIKAGGIAGVARSPEEGKKIIEQWTCNRLI